MDKNKIVIALVIIIYIFASGISYFLFNKAEISQSSQHMATTVSPKKLGDSVQFDQSLPKTESCPLNGVLYSAQQKQWWDKHRPMAIMIENSLDARPQSGISFADITYEALAEGGITRTMNIFYCQDAGFVGPVRSARTYFLDYASEYGDYPLYVHVGGANTSGPADALSQINEYGWGNYNNLDQFAIGFPVFWRDYDRLGHPVATEHTMYSSTTKLWEYAAQNRGLTNVNKDGVSWDKGFVPYTYKDDSDISKRPTSQEVSFDFTGNYDDYGVVWTYDRATNTYLRSNGGKPHIDRNTQKQLSAKTVLILDERESHADDGYQGNEHMLYGTKGTGKAVIFMDGKQIVGTWSKASRTARTKISDASGKELQFNRGKIWFEILGIGNTLTVK